MTLRTLNYGNYGIFLIMGNAGFCPSTVSRHPRRARTVQQRRCDTQTKGNGATSAARALLLLEDRGGDIEGHGRQAAELEG